MSKIRILTPVELADRDRSQQGVPDSQPEERSTPRQPASPTDATAHIISTFEHLYPTTARFVNHRGYIEIGSDDDSPLTSFIRALDSGGMIWEGLDEYPSLDAAFQDLEQALMTGLRKTKTV